MPVLPVKCEAGRGLVKVDAVDAKVSKLRKNGKSRGTFAAHATPKNGIMSSMKNRAKPALALALAIVGAVAAPLRSDASVRKVQTSLVPIHALLCAESRHCT